jgi:hypothetical protein
VTQTEPSARKSAKAGSFAPGQVPGGILDFGLPILDLRIGDSIQNPKSKIQNRQSKIQNWVTKFRKKLSQTGSKPAFEDRSASLAQPLTP